MQFLKYSSMRARFTWTISLIRNRPCKSHADNASSSDFIWRLTSLSKFCNPELFDCRYRSCVSMTRLAKEGSKLPRISGPSETTTRHPCARGPAHQQQGTV